MRIAAQAVQRLNTGLTETGAGRLEFPYASDFMLVKLGSSSYILGATRFFLWRFRDDQIGRSIVLSPDCLFRAASFSDSKIPRYNGVERCDIPEKLKNLKIGM